MRRRTVPEPRTSAAHEGTEPRTKTTMSKADRDETETETETVTVTEPPMLPPLHHYADPESTTLYDHSGDSAEAWLSSTKAYWVALCR